jgi:hypothetical protein
MAKSSVFPMPRTAQRSGESLAVSLASVSVPSPITSATLRASWRAHVAEPLYVCCYHIWTAVRFCSKKRTLMPNEGRKIRRESLALGVTLMRLAVGLEPLSIRGAHTPFSPDPVCGNDGVPRWPGSPRPLSRQRAESLIRLLARSQAVTCLTPNSGLLLAATR